MATSNLGQFDALFDKTVPHILQRIFFSLDYNSFMNCYNVCKTWHNLLSSEQYQMKSQELLKEKKNNEKNLLKFSGQGKEKAVRKLLSSGVDPNCEDGVVGWTPLSYACRLKVTKLLLGAGADPNKSCPLMRAASRGRLDIAKTLLDAGANPNKVNSFGHSPLLEAINHGNADVVKLLLDNGADPNVRYNGVSPLTCALSQRNTDIAKLLIDRGATPTK